MAAPAALQSMEKVGAGGTAVAENDNAVIGRKRRLSSDTTICYHLAVKRKHQRTLELIFSRPVSAHVRWADIEALFVELGGQVAEREGSRVLVRLFGDRRVFHRPHPEPTTDKGAVEAVRKWLEEHGVKP
jgi:hypothetical protein